MSLRKGAGFTLVELLVVIAIISVIAGLLIPTLVKSRGEVVKLQCMNNLKELGKLSVIYCGPGGESRFFPVAPGNPPLAYQSLQLLADYHKDLDGELFVCPESRDDPAVREEGQVIQLTEDNVSYAWTTERLMPTDSSSTPLGSDNSIKDPTQEIKENHADGMNILYVTGRVIWQSKKKLGERELPKGLGK